MDLAAEKKEAGLLDINRSEKDTNNGKEGGHEPCSRVARAAVLNAVGGELLRGRHVKA